MTKDVEYMHIAFEVAFSKLGTTSPNPPVGAIIVKNDFIISKGGTQRPGYDHAEITAIKNAKEDLHGADIYVTLEPCCHYGRTPPCTDAIIKSGIKRVVIPLIDPNPLVAGKGVKKLKEAGIEVIILANLKDYAEQILNPFLTYINHGRAHIIHKSAITLDGKIATCKKDSKWISSQTSRLLSHRLRSLVDGIIIGKGTFEADNPALDVRLDEFNPNLLSDLELNFSGIDNIFIQNICKKNFIKRDNNPLRILIGLPDEINPDAPFFKDDNFCIFIHYDIQHTLMQLEEESFYNKLLETGKIILIKYNNQIQFINEVIDFLTKKGLNFLLLEGGSCLGTNFLKAGLIDQIMYFIAPKIVGEGVPIYGDINTDYIDNCKTIANVTNTMLENDILYHGYMRY